MMNAGIFVCKGRQRSSFFIQKHFSEFTML